MQPASRSRWHITIVKCSGRVQSDKHLFHSLVMLKRFRRTLYILLPFKKDPPNSKKNGYYTYALSHTCSRYPSLHLTRTEKNNKRNCYCCYTREISSLEKGERKEKPTVKICRRGVFLLFFSYGWWNVDSRRKLLTFKKNICFFFFKKRDDAEMKASLCDTRVQNIINYIFG